MIAHGISTGALFMLVGGLQERTHTREMDRLQGLWTTVPVMSGTVLFFAMASIGLPGLGDFLGEFLTLLGTYRVSLGVTMAAAIGILISTLYALKVIQRAFHGPNTHEWSIPDLGARELLMMVPMMADPAVAGPLPAAACSGLLSLPCTSFRNMRSPSPS